MQSVRPSEQALAAASFTRIALFAAILIICSVDIYDYVADILYNKASESSGVVGFLVAFIAMVEMGMSDSKDGKRSTRWAGEEASIPYSFFVLGGLVTSGLLLMQYSSGAIIFLLAVHLSTACAVVTVIIGVTIMRRHSYLFGSEGSGINEDEI